MMMDFMQAKELLTVLAGGINPITGELLPKGDSCNQIEVVRALYTVLRKLDSQSPKASKALPENAGKPWSEEDEEALGRMFDEGYTKKEICSYFKRTSGSIAARFVKLGRIKDRYDYK